jgi:hypothetical protein
MNKNGRIVFAVRLASSITDSFSHRDDAAIRRDRGSIRPINAAERKNKKVARNSR